MHVNLCDTRSLALVVAKPPQDQFWNWARGSWEQPFVPANHMRTLSTMEASSSIFATVKTADIGDVLLQYVDAVVLVVTLNADGSPSGVVDLWTSPNPVAYPTFGGYSR